MNILFIGNSYTYYNDMPLLFQQLAIDNGMDVHVDSVTKGGRKLLSYTDPQDEITARLDQLLEQRTYELCFVQEQSLTPIIGFDRFLEGLDCVFQKAAGRARRMILYATWGRKAGSPQLAELDMDTRRMAQQLNESYCRAAQQLGAEVSPVGSAFLTVCEQHPEIELYDPDLSHPSRPGSCLAALTHYYTAFGQFPDHTQSLNLSEQELDAFRAAVLSNA